MYPGTFGLNDIYVKSFLAGGPTLPQLMYLFETGAKRKHQEFIRVAALHGVELDDPFASTSAKAPKSKVKSSDGFVFGDPEAYSDCTVEERKSLTKSMLQKHKVWNSTGYVE